MKQAFAELARIPALVDPYVASLGLTGYDCLQFAGVALISWMGCHAITQGDMRR